MAARIAARCRQLISLQCSLYSRSSNCVSTIFANRHLVPSSHCIHTSSIRHGLDEFFEDKKLWTETEIVCGRPWKLDELRIKSNEDLHKLWYVLLKERNMLMTMEHEYKRASELFPSPERLDKVDESMRNILSVVDERNEAYNLLETGKTGKPEMIEKRNFLGIKVKTPAQEHIIPPYMNTIHKALWPGYTKLRGKYLKLYAEKLRKQLNRARKLEKLQGEEIKKRFPDAEIEKKF